MMVSRKAGGGKGPKKPSSVTKAYLLLYNGVLTLGWAVSYEISFKDVSTFALSSLISIGPHNLHDLMQYWFNGIYSIQVGLGNAGFPSSLISSCLCWLSVGQLGMLSHVSALAKPKAVQLVWLCCAALHVLCTFAAAQAHIIFIFHSAGRFSW